MDKIIKSIYKDFCTLTKRSGGVLVGSSIGEWHRFLAMKLEEYNFKMVQPEEHETNKILAQKFINNKFGRLN
jgi:hypothetical protein